MTIIYFIVLTSIGMLYDRYIKKFFPDEELNKYNLERKYLLNETDSVLGKPLLWIHTTHNINSRKWPSFYSRNTRQLNQSTRGVMGGPPVRFNAICLLK